MITLKDYIATVLTETIKAGAVGNIEIEVGVAPCDGIIYVTSVDYPGSSKIKLTLNVGQ